MEGLEGRYGSLGLPGVALIVILAAGTCLTAYFLLRKRIERKLLLAALCLFLVVFSASLAIILQNHFISGADGTYYVYQTRYLLQHGTTSEFAPPVVFYVLAGFSGFANDITLGVKIAQAFFPALITLTAFLFVKYVVKNNFATLGVSLFTAIILSGLAVQICALKNMAALVMAPLFYIFFIKFVKGEGRKWRIKNIKIGRRKFSLVLSAPLLISVGLYLLVLATHDFTAGFVLMSIVAYIALYMGYCRKVPWQEIKFLVLLGVLISFALLSSTLRHHIIGTANTIAESDPVPEGVFPFTAQISEFPLLAFLPIIALTLPAAWFILRQRDRRLQLFVAMLLMTLLGTQPWIINSNYVFRFGFMIFLSLLPLLGISIWVLRKPHPKVSAGILVVGIIFATAMFVTMATGIARVGPSFAISDEQLNALSGIRERLPENVVICASSREIVPDEWGLLLLDRKVVYLVGGEEPPLTIQNIAERLANYQQQENKTCLALVPAELVENVENLAEFGIRDTGLGNAYIRVLELENSYLLNAGGKEGVKGLSGSLWVTSQDNQHYWEAGPQPTNEIRFNSNPLFAFILLPIELVQGLYGTAVYGIVKLLVAIPLTIGLIGFLIGLFVIVFHKFKS